MNKNDLDKVGLFKDSIDTFYIDSIEETNSLTTSTYNLLQTTRDNVSAVQDKIGVLGDMVTDLRILNGTAKTIQYLSNLDVVENSGVKIENDRFELDYLTIVEKEINSSTSSISSLEAYQLKFENNKTAYLEDLLKTDTEVKVIFPTPNYTFSLNLMYDNLEQINTLSIQLGILTQSYPLILSIKYVDKNNNLSDVVILNNNSKNINLDESRLVDNLYTLNITPVVTNQLVIEFSSRDQSQITLRSVKTSYRTSVDSGYITLGPIYSNDPILKLALNSDELSTGVTFEISTDNEYWLPLKNSSSIIANNDRKIIAFNTINSNSIKTDEDVYSLYIKITLNSSIITNDDIPISIFNTNREDNTVSNDIINIVSDNQFSAYRVKNSDFYYGNYFYTTSLNTSRLSLDKIEYLENDGVLKVLGLVGTKYSVTNSNNEGISVGSIGLELKLHRLGSNKVIDARGFDLANSVIYDVYPREISGTVNTKQKDNFCLMLKRDKIIEAPVVEPEEPIFTISCDGAINSVLYAIALDQYGLDNIEEVVELGQFVVNGVSIPMNTDASDIGIGMMSASGESVPYPIDSGFTVMAIQRLYNLDTSNKTFEIKSSSPHLKFYLWDNPTVNRIDGLLAQHTGVCLSANTESQTEITCDGATSEIGIMWGTGLFDPSVVITINDVIVTGRPDVRSNSAGSFEMGGYSFDYRGTGDASIGLASVNSETLRIKFDVSAPSSSRVVTDYVQTEFDREWVVSSANPTYHIDPIANTIQFCLAPYVPYVPPIEEPAWDIKYLVNGSWIFESTGSTVEQNADRNMYKNGATALVIADTVTTLGSGVFGNWNALTSVELGQSVRSIGNSAFAFCSNLTEFKCPNSLESLGYSALNSCTKLRLLEFGTNLISIGASACISCYVLETVVFRARNMPTVGQYAFGNGGSGSPVVSAVYVPDDLFNEYAEAIWNLADISKFRSLSTYEP